MADILFVTWDGGGNVPPAVGIAAELRSRGHAVRVIGHVGVERAVTTAGLPFTAYERARPFDSTAANSPLVMLATFGDRRMGQDVLAELRTRPADIVVVDCLLFGVMDALDRAGRPYLVLEHLYDAYLQRLVRGPIGIGLRLKGIRARRLLESGVRRLVAASPDLDPNGRSAPAPDGKRSYTWPVVSGRPAAPVEPTVLVSLSTFNFPGQVAALQHILDAVAELPVRAVVTTGPSIDPARLTAPANAELHRWLPHADVLPTVSLLVGHGGHATTMAALAHDLPVLVLPMHAQLDQPMVGRSVEAAGAGRMLPKKADVARIRAAIGELVGDGPHRSAAARLGAAIRAARGASAAADQIESLVPGAVRRS